jgi:hypothetical protein
MITTLKEWSTVTVDKLQELWGGFLNFIPKLVGALVVFLVGWIVAVWVGKIIAEILKRLKFDRIFEKTKWESAMEKANFKMTMSSFIGGLVKWILIIVFLSSAVRILGLSQVGDFVDNIVGWLPNLIVAAGIFVVAVVVAEFAEKLIKATVSKMNVAYVNLIGAITRWAVWIFAALAILNQFRVEAAEGLIQIVVAGVVFSMALAFGLGGKDVAREMLEDVRMRMKE